MQYLMRVVLLGLMVMSLSAKADFDDITWSSVTLADIVGIDVNKRDDAGRTALYFSVRSGKNLDVVKELIKKGANINAAEEYGYTPLHAAALNDKGDFIFALVDAGAFINARNVNALTPLHLASEGSPFSWGKSNLAAIRALIAVGADLNVSDSNGDTPLHRVAFFVTTEAASAMQLLIEAGADVNTINKYGNTPLQAAINKNNQVAATLLLEAGGHL